jgi:hypothetical protein
MAGLGVFMLWPSEFATGAQSMIMLCLAQLVHGWAVDSWLIHLWFLVGLWLCSRRGLLM